MSAQPAVTPVPRQWPGETAFILAGGPSLRGFNASVLAGRRVITVNNSWELLPSADVLYFCDLGWWKVHGERVKREFRGELFSVGDIRDSKVRRLRKDNGAGLSTDPTKLRGQDSGYHAINLAYHFGVSRIVLLGYDMQNVGEQTHWHQGHGKDAAHNHHMLSKVFLPRYQHLVTPLADAGVEVLNCNPDSALTCWPYRPLDEILRECSAVAA